MVRKLCIISVLTFLAAISTVAIRAQAPPAAPAVTPAPTQVVARSGVAAGDAATYTAVVDRYCVTCHNDRQKTGNMSLQGHALIGVTQDAELWEKVIKKISTGSMPPVGLPRPDAQTAASFVGWLEQTLDGAAAAKPNPGRPMIHRLNRAEYANAVRDLLALDVDATALLPPDELSHGFDNIADALTVSPVLLERYLGAADKISAMAVGDPQTSPGSETIPSRADSHQLEHIEGLPLGTRGGLLIERNFPLDAEYEISATLYRTNNGFTRGLASAHEIEFNVDGERVFSVTVGGPDDWAKLLANPANADEFDARLKARVKIKAGPRKVGVTFVEKTAARNPTLLRPMLGASDPVDADGVPRIDAVLLSGPFNPTGPGDTPSRRAIFSCTPASRADERRCAGTILSSIGRRAFRRPLAAPEVGTLLTFFDMGRQRRGSFEGGVQLALRRILADPAFIFRAERDPATVAVGATYRVSDLELASRLSFFLWSSIPDDQLLQVAAAGRLKDPAVYAQQVKRMIADPKSAALVENFAGQWLQLRNLQRVNPNPMEFPEFDDNLRQGFRRETELLVDNILRQNRPVLELLTADYTFVNERLARHYGLSGVHGSNFRRVTVTDEMRKGLLGHGSILALTSHPNRTSPVKRGKWILENLMGSPPPPPPPNVPPLAESNTLPTPRTMKERMAEHRANPTCANCHRLMDPLGLAMENFDAVGAYRTRDLGVKIDPSSQLSDGTQVGGIVDLRNSLLRRPEVFLRTFTESLLTYGLGRGLTAADMPAVRAVMKDAAGQSNAFQAFVLGIANSTPFKMRIKTVDEE